MPNALLPEWESPDTPVVGMVHLGPLPGSPAGRLDPDAIRAAALADAERLVAGGVHGLIIENLGDSPFTAGRVPSHTVAMMTAVAADIRRAFEVPLGINVLRNDGVSAMGIAAAVGARFIRVNILCGARLTDQGIIGGIAHDLLRARRAIDARDVKILADVNVKHSAPLAAYDPRQEVADLVERGGADGLVVSGTGTGVETDAGELRLVREAAPDTPLFVGSGVTDVNVDRYLADADGLIVGSWFKQQGEAANAVDPDRVLRLMARVGGR